MNDIGVADFNRDGRADVACATGAQTSIHLSQPEGFTIMSGLLQDSAVLRVDVGDINGDGYEDVVAESNTSSLQLFLGSGDGSFQIGAEFPSYLGDVGFGQLDDDGQIDLVLLGPSQSVMSVVRQNQGPPGTTDHSLRVSPGKTPPAMFAEIAAIGIFW